MGRDEAVIGRKGQTICALLATHAAIALIAADRLRQFQTALASRDLVGQAKGILMKRFDIHAD
jgi:AmiR/NasT family two-component response regulator